MSGMSPDAIREELFDIKHELDRLETLGAPKHELDPIRERIAAIEKHLLIHTNIAA
jgi:hypothetical protein